MKKFQLISWHLLWGLSFIWYFGVPRHFWWKLWRNIPFCYFYNLFLPLQSPRNSKEMYMRCSLLHLVTQVCWTWKVQEIFWRFTLDSAATEKWIQFLECLIDSSFPTELWQSKQLKISPSLSVALWLKFQFETHSALVSMSIVVAVMMDRSQK